MFYFITEGTYQRRQTSHLVSLNAKCQTLQRSDQLVWGLRSGAVNVCETVLKSLHTQGSLMTSESDRPQHLFTQGWVNSSMLRSECPWALHQAAVEQMLVRSAPSGLVCGWYLFGIKCHCWGLTWIWELILNDGSKHCFKQKQTAAQHWPSMPCMAWTAPRQWKTSGPVLRWQENKLHNVLHAL